MRIFWKTKPPQAPETLADTLGGLVLVDYDLDGVREAEEKKLLRAPQAKVVDRLNQMTTIRFVVETIKPDLMQAGLAQLQQGVVLKGEGTLRMEAIAYGGLAGIRQCDGVLIARGGRYVVGVSVQLRYVFVGGGIY